MNVQDRKKTLTAEELRRRYNLDDLNKDRKAIKLSKEEIIKIDKQLNDFVEAATNSLQDLQNQVDGNITTWFYNGVPTTSNQPAFNWTTDEEKINHLGDLYYDQNTGYAYRWAFVNNVYDWSRIVDADVVEALAVANAAQDTADSKRRVFVTTPTPPYDIGDIWIKDDKDLYRCKTAAPSTGSYSISHWTKATNYTDDTVANQALQEIGELETEVHENYATTVDLNTTADSIRGSVSENYTFITNVEAKVDANKTTTDQQILDVINTVEANQTATAYSISVINEQLINGVTKFSTGTGYTFDLDGLKINKTDSVMNLVLDNNGLVVYRNTDKVLEVNSDGVNAENITVRKFYVQKPLRVEKTKSISDPTKSGWGIFWVGE